MKTVANQAALPHGETPSAWVRRFVHLVPADGSVLDVACGRGRHLRWLAQQGFAVTGVDRSADAQAACAGIGRFVLADIEHGPWPFHGQRFDCVLVTNYLWRPLLPTLVQSVAPGGVLIYETFARGNGAVGKPSNPAFLLEPGELWRASEGLRVVAYENGFIAEPERFVQRIAAVRLDESAQSAGAAPARLALQDRSATATDAARRHLPAA